ncbi:Lrp/AsnC ligand binding domain-containing protein [Embleya sp. NPDC127516]|uniref:Lrp/AsnC ligand binding domain-containing protein n=1 Tax=Embleya sp. NPDC127516 TaxID=3363990 RepID=UPI00380FEA2B
MTKSPPEGPAQLPPHRKHAPSRAASRLLQFAPIGVRKSTSARRLCDPDAPVRRSVPTSTPKRSTSAHRPPPSDAHVRGRSRRRGFEQALVAVPHVIQTQRPFGEPAYLLRVATTDPGAFQRLYDRQLAKLPGVQR